MLKILWAIILSQDLLTMELTLARKDELIIVIPSALTKS